MAMECQISFYGKIVLKLSQCLLHNLSKYFFFFWFSLETSPVVNKHVSFGTLKPTDGVSRGMWDSSAVNVTVKKMQTSPVGSLPKELLYSL